MRVLAAVFTLFFIGSAVAQAPPSFQPVGTMSQLMLDIVYPTSNAIFYVQRNPPKTDQDWNTLRATALTLAESGNLLMMDTRARDRGDWIKDSQMLVDTGRDAWKAAQAKNLNAIVALNDRLYAACVTCHERYRPGYRKRQ
jgi:hypothetical protein